MLPFVLGVLGGKILAVLYFALRVIAGVFVLLHLHSPVLAVLALPLPRSPVRFGTLGRADTIQELGSSRCKCIGSGSTLCTHGCTAHRLVSSTYRVFCVVLEPLSTSFRYDELGSLGLDLSLR
jgi:hypothetical protein